MLVLPCFRDCHGVDSSCLAFDLTMKAELAGTIARLRLYVISSLPELHLNYCAVEYGISAATLLVTFLAVIVCTCPPCGVCSGFVAGLL